MAKGEKSTVKAQDIVRAQKTAEAMELRLQGWTLAQIAEAIGVTSTTAHNYIMRALEARVHPKREQLRDLMHDRYEAILTGLMPQAVQGDAVAIDRALVVMRDLRQMLGLDQPTQFAVSGKMKHDHTGAVAHTHGGKIVVELVRPGKREIDGEIVDVEPAVPEIEKDG